MKTEIPDLIHNGYLYKILFLEPMVYKIVEFINDKSITFTVKAELSGFDTMPHIYKLVDKGQILPQRILDVIPIISDEINEITREK